MRTLKLARRLLHYPMLLASFAMSRSFDPPARLAAVCLNSNFSGTPTKADEHAHHFVGR